MFDESRVSKWRPERREREEAEGRRRKQRIQNRFEKEAKVTHKLLSAESLGRSTSIHLVQRRDGRYSEDAKR